MSIRIRIIASALLGLGLACSTATDGGGGGGTGTLNVTKASGDNQTAVVATQLSADFCVEVKEGNQEKSGVAVAWSTSAGAGSLMVPSSSSSGSNGLACSRMTLGQTAGTQNATATVSGATGSPATFTATALAGNATTLVQSGGDNQTAAAGVQYSEPLTVRTVDQFNNGVNGASIIWALTQGSANLSATSTSTAGAGAQAGFTSITVTPNAAGAIVITASSGSLAGSPQTFNLTANPAPVPPDRTITVGNSFFRSDRNASTPAVDTVKVGQTVSWTWAPGAVGHTVKADGAGFTTGTEGAPKNAPFTTGNVTINLAPGTYGYHCEIHGSPGSLMFGTLVVEP